MDIRPIKTEKDYEWAMAEVAKYFEDQPQVGSEDGNRFDVLSDLIEAYENRHYPIVAPDPVGTIDAYMQMAGLKQAALATLLGSKSRASEIMNRKRPLTVDQIFKLSDAWKIPADALVRPYHLSVEEQRRERSRIPAP